MDTSMCWNENILGVNSRREVLKGQSAGTPQSTDRYSSAELSAMGMVGVYGDPVREDGVRREVRTWER